MDFIPSDISAYCEAHTEPESPLLAELNRETHLRVSSPRMLSGHLQGRILSFLSKLKQPKVILEIGTYTGYSALCLAEGLAPGGKLYTIDPNEETMYFATRYFKRSPYSESINAMLGNAQNIIPQIKEPFDLVFIDADKNNYSLYYDLVVERTNAGGLIIADNVLWSGKVVQADPDADTSALMAYSTKVISDSRVESVMLPVRDGLLVLRKK